LFAYTASHNLKEPLRKIHLYILSVLEHSREILDKKSREYLNHSMNAAHASTFIEELLNHSKTTVGTNDFENVDLNEVITAIEQIYKDAIEGDKIYIQRDHLPTIKRIAFQINQLIENLINRC
jgi:light-regulated signal transduction histidine kinase (bacteriophytochrome)